MRIGVEDHGARADGALADPELPVEHVPHLGEVVPVAWVTGAGLVAHETGVGLGRPLGPRVEDHLAVLAGKPEGLPRHLVDVPVLRAVIARRLAHRCPPSWARRHSMSFDHWSSSGSTTSRPSDGSRSSTRVKPAAR